MTAHAPSQDGYLWPSAVWGGDDAWHDTTTFAALGQTGPAGLIFDLPVASYTAMTLTLEKVPPIFGVGGVGTGTLDLYVVNQAAPGLFSTGSPPTVAGASLVASLPFAALGVGEREFTLDMTAVNAVTALPGWAGRLKLVLVSVWIAEGVQRTFASVEHADPAVRPVLEATGTAIPVVVPAAARPLRTPRSLRARRSDGFRR